MKQLLITIVALVLVGCGPSISIHKASEEGNIEVVKQHLAAGTDVNEGDEDGDTPLIYAVEEGLKEAAELLIANGAKVNVKDNILDSTPLHQAFMRRKMEVIGLLIANGADVNAKSRTGATPLGWAENYPQKYPGIRAIFDKHGIKYGGKLKAFKAAGN